MSQGIFQEMNISCSHEPKWTKASKSRFTIYSTHWYIGKNPANTIVSPRKSWPMTNVPSFLPNCFTKPQTHANNLQSVFSFRIVLKELKILNHTYAKFKDSLIQVESNPSLNHNGNQMTVDNHCMLLLNNCKTNWLTLSHVSRSESVWWNWSSSIFNTSSISIASGME